LRQLLIVFVTAAITLSAALACADLTVPALIGDHMVVQQGKPVHL
jgi:hypothetical protein